MGGRRAEHPLWGDTRLCARAPGFSVKRTAFCGEGRLPPRQKIYFGSPYDIRVEFAGTQTIKVSDSSMEADRLNVSLKGAQADVNFEMYFLKNAERTPVLVRVPLAVGTFSMELMK